MNLYYHFGKIFVAQGVLRKNHQNPQVTMIYLQGKAKPQ